MLLYLALGGLGALAALALIAFVVGGRLPSTYTARGSMRLALEPQALWDALADVEAHPRGAAMTRAVERLPDVDGRPSWAEDLGQTTVTWTAVEWEPPRRMVCEARDSVVPMTARWEFELVPLDGATSLRVASEVVIADGTWHVPLFRVMMNLTNGARRGLTDFLKRVDSSLDPRSVEWEEA